MADLQTRTTESVPLAPSLAQPEASQRPARLAAYTGTALILGGLIALYLGYDGTATHSIQVAQTPYLISGGMFGTALIILGGIAIAMVVVLQIHAGLTSELRAMRAALDEFADSLAHQNVGATSAAVATNGHVMVARGASSYHRANCRLVARADHVRPVAKEQASDAGLTPCRVCKP